MEGIGVNNNEKEWFKSSLNNREQQTKIDNLISSKIVNNFGVPQGAVLASTLFSIYINDICEITKNIENANINLFADDTEIHVTTDNLQEGIDKMNQIIFKLDNYFKLNKLKLNTNKTKVMIIKNKNKQIDLNGIQFKIENQSLEIVHELKYLGIIIDDELNFNRHIDYICKKASSKVGLLHRIKNKMKVENRICIYKTIIAPHFEYCPTILFLLNESQFERLQKIQN